jgi:hypothetical protein
MTSRATTSTRSPIPGRSTRRPGRSTFATPRRVVTLLTSPELQKTAGGDDAVAITFGVEPTPTGGGSKKSAAVATGAELSQDRKTMKGGRVVYVLSHFGKQESTSDEHSLQNLLINFLVEANERRGTGPAGPAPPSRNSAPGKSRIAGRGAASSMDVELHASRFHPHHGSVREDHLGESARP